MRGGLYGARGSSSGLKYIAISYQRSAFSFRFRQHRR
jgi:hypothetical protein